MDFKSINLTPQFRLIFARRGEVIKVKIMASYLIPTRKNTVHYSFISTMLQFFITT